MRTVLFLLHEFGRLFDIPSPLGLIEKGDMLNRWPVRIDKAVVSEVVHVLNEGFNLAASLPQFDFDFSFGFPLYLVARQRLPEDADQGSIAREKHAVKIIRLVDILSGDVETHQCFSSAGNTCDEANGLF